MSPLATRSSEESRLFLELQPCADCGGPALEVVAQWLGEDADGVLVSGYQTRCARCDAAAEFEFTVPVDPPAPPRFGGSEPSQLIDAGQFCAVARDLAAAVPADPAHCPPGERADAREAMALAVAALAEVGKFLPAGGDEMPLAAFFTPAGRAEYGADPTQFTRRRLAALDHRYQQVLAAYET